MPKRDSTTPPFTGYRIPDDGKFRTINFSGGRSSAYMLRHILDAHDGELPPQAAVVFTNTGKEREETLQFVARLEEAWEVKIHWLEFFYDFDAKGGRANPKRNYRHVDYASAARNGEPFASLIESRKMLPNVAQRVCTDELKVSTASRFTRWELGWPRRQTKRILGIRYDEPKRWAKALTDECDSEYPMVHGRVTREMVDDFWRGHPLDLSIPSDLGNCDLCFLKGVRKLSRTMRREPERVQWWAEQETKFVRRQKNGNKDATKFSQRWSYAGLLKETLDSPMLPGFDGDDEGIDCFCTD